MKETKEEEEKEKEKEKETREETETREERANRRRRIARNNQIYEQRRKYFLKYILAIFEAGVCLITIGALITWCCFKHGESHEYSKNDPPCPPPTTTSGSKTFCIVGGSFCMLSGLLTIYIGLKELRQYVNEAPPPRQQSVPTPVERQNLLGQQGL
jgi:hypothetical protein